MRIGFSITHKGDGNKMGLTKHIEGMIIALMAALGAVVPLLLMSYVVIILDNLAAIASAFKNGDKLESRLLRHTGAKLAVATISILAASAIDYYFGLTTITAVKIIATAIIVSEFKSIVEHLENMFKVNVYHKLVSLLHPNSQEKKRIPPSQKSPLNNKKKNKSPQSRHKKRRNHVAKNK